MIENKDQKTVTGKEAQRANIQAAIEVVNVVKATLGPRGTDVMIVDELGDVTVSNDGVTILREMKIEHPIGKMMVEIAKTQEDTVGDGTTTAVILAGELLKRAQDLLDRGLHPTTIARGYRMAEKAAQEILDKNCVDINIESRETLKNVAMTAMVGKSAEGSKEHLAEIVYGAINRIAQFGKVDPQDIKIEAIYGGAVEQSTLIDGIILNKEKAHPSMRTNVEEAIICCLTCPLEVQKLSSESTIQITSPEQFQMFVDQEKASMEEMMSVFVKNQVDVIFCSRNIDDAALHLLQKGSIMAVKRVNQQDLQRISKATKATMVNHWLGLSGLHLGKAHVREEVVGKENIIMIEKCMDAKAISILVRASTPHLAEEIKRAVTDAIGDVAAAVNDGRVVSGAGTIEMVVSRKLRDRLSEQSGKESIAFQSFAEAMEVIPTTLAENAGVDAVEILSKIKRSPLVDYGVDVYGGDVMVAWDQGVIEPLKIKSQALSSATEVAEMILRINHVVLGKEKSRQKGDGAGTNELNFG